MKQHRIKAGTPRKARILRNNATHCEELLWQRLRRKQIRGYLFTRQKPIGPYIVDFYCHRLELAIEVDGGSHIGNEVKDELRQKFIEKFGIRFLRFPNAEVKYNMEKVISAIEGYMDNCEQP